MKSLGSYSSGALFCRIRISYDPLSSATEGLWTISVMLLSSILEGQASEFLVGAEQNGVELN